LEEDSPNSMSSSGPQQFGFYHSQSKTFFYFETQAEFNQFLELYRKYETQIRPQIEEISRPNLDSFNTVFEELNSSSYDSVEELRELDF
jgi:hypothetical protein